MVVVPVVFGEHLVPGYYGFALHTVVQGDTLSAIAQEAYGDASKYLRIFAANRNQLSDPNRIFPGQPATGADGQPDLSSASGP